MNGSDLEKGLKKLEEAAAVDNPHARRAQLFQKAQSGEITPEENDELLKSLGGGDGLAAEATASLRDNSVIQKSMDVSDYLREATAGMISGLESIADHIAKSNAQDQGFRMALAQTLTAQGEMLKSMQAQIDTLSGQPARAPKSQGVQAGQPIEKSFGGGNLPDNSLSKSQILDTMSNMLQKGMSAAGGEDLLVAAAKYENSSEMSPSVYNAVMDFHNNQAA